MLGHTTIFLEKELMAINPSFLELNLYVANLTKCDSLWTNDVTISSMCTAIANNRKKKEEMCAVFTVAAAMVVLEKSTIPASACHFGLQRQVEAHTLVQLQTVVRR